MGGGVRRDDGKQSRRLFAKYSVRFVVLKVVGTL